MTHTHTQKRHKKEQCNKNNKEGAAPDEKEQKKNKQKRTDENTIPT